MEYEDKTMAAAAAAHYASKRAEYSNDNKAGRAIKQHQIRALTTRHKQRTHLRLPPCWRSALLVD
jgi:hypothetical protein